MNAACYCVPVARSDIDASLAKTAPDIADMLEHMPTVFAGTAVFVGQADMQAMRAQIRAIETIAALPAYQDFIAARDGIDPNTHNTHGLFMGYDFHITKDGPRLIEINTNAGGAYLIAMLEEALTPDTLQCAQNSHQNNHAGHTTSRRLLTDTFAAEWRRARQTKLTTIAIVDEDPSNQYLYPELVIIQKELEAMGVRAIITDPSALNFDGEILSSKGQRIDMVYNRLTDFDLSGPRGAALKAAYQANAIVLSPAPAHHALFADKRNLAVLGDAHQLGAWGVDASEIDILQAIPTTRDVTAENADALWANRRRYFFKPKAGYGSRGSYRGAKLTTRVWSQIIEGGYVAQEYIPPTVRALERGGERTQLKFDVRIYTYGGETLAVAARVYQGQATNFRTQGGGFAAVLMSETCP